MFNKYHSKKLNNKKFLLYKHFLKSAYGKLTPAVCRAVNINVALFFHGTFFCRLFKTF